MLCFHRQGERGASILVPALTEENKRIEEFLVDLTLPMHLFEALFRSADGPHCHTLVVDASCCDLCVHRIVICVSVHLLESSSSVVLVVKVLILILSLQTFRREEDE